MPEETDTGRGCGYVFLPVVLCDLDAAFLGFELLRRPELRGRCVVVGGTPEQRGVVSTASYPARRFGVRSGMSTAAALRLCPEAVLLPVDMPYYHRMAERFHAVVAAGVAIWEPVGLDEVYLDLSGHRRTLPDTRAFCEDLRARVAAELGLSCSVAAAAGRALAKVACEVLAKPGGVGLLPQQEAAAVLGPLPVGVLPGVGPATAATLARYGLRTCAQLVAAPAEWLQRRLGAGAQTLQALAGGTDHSRPQPPGPARSLSVDQTFPSDLHAAPDIQRAFSELCWRLSQRLAAEGVWPRQLGVRWRTPDFADHSRQRTFGGPLCTRQEVRQVARRLWAEADVSRPVRLLSVQAGLLVPRQPPLLPSARLEATLGALEAQGVEIFPAALLGSAACCRR